ncbi:hypothetical protein [Nonomuraea cavernae]|uniref:hypothetical protein n=1 Tax=Nonomuraea cavernae TaxID=2045107 RepID=UPI0033D8B2E9
MDALRLPDLVATPARRQRAILSRLSGPGPVARLLEGLLADEAAVLRVARMSYRHPLGFDKYVLWCRHPAGRLHMHVWWPDAHHEREHIHNHRFAFSSAVVAGVVRSALFERSETGRPYDRFTDSTPLHADGWRLERRDTVVVARSATLEVCAGSAYSQAASTLHRVEVTAGPAVTLFLEGPVTRSHSEVLIEPGQRPPGRLRRTPFTPDELRERLTLVGETLLGP